MSKGITKILRTNLRYKGLNWLTSDIKFIMCELLYITNEPPCNILIVYDKNFTIVFKLNYPRMHKYKAIINFRAANDKTEIYSAKISELFDMIEKHLDILYFKHLNKLGANTPEKRSYEYRQLKRKFNKSIAKKLKKVQK